MQFHTALLNFMCDMTLVSQTVTAHRVTTCLENLEMSGNLTAVREMSGIFAKSQGIVREKNLVREKLPETVYCKLQFVSIQVFSRSLLCLKC